MPSLDNWIDEQKQSGAPIEDVKKALLTRGYGAPLLAEVDKVYNAGHEQEQESDPAKKKKLLVIGLIVGMLGLAVFVGFMIGKGRTQEVESGWTEVRTPQTIIEKEIMFVNGTELDIFSGNQYLINPLEDPIYLKSFYVQNIDGNYVDSTASNITLEKGGLKVDLPLHPDTTYVKLEDDVQVPASADDLVFGKQVIVHVQVSYDSRTVRKSKVIMAG